MVKNRDWEKAHRGDLARAPRKQYTPTSAPTWPERVAHLEVAVKQLEKDNKNLKTVLTELLAKYGEIVELWKNSS